MVLDKDNTVHTKRGTDKVTDKIKMSKLYLILSVVLMLKASRACNEQNEEEQLIAARQQSDEYFANAFGLTPNPWGSSYYQSAADLPGKNEKFDSVYTQKSIVCLVQFSNCIAYISPFSYIKFTI